MLPLFYKNQLLTLANINLKCKWSNQPIVAMLVEFAVDNSSTQIHLLFEKIQCVGEKRTIRELRTYAVIVSIGIPL